MQTNREKKKEVGAFASLGDIPGSLSKKRRGISSSMDDILTNIQDERDGVDTASELDTSASSEIDTEEECPETKVSRKQKLFAKKTIKWDKKREKDLKKKVEKNQISMEDFSSKQSEFKMWLVEEKNKSVGCLSSPKLKAYFKQFVRLWNKKKLDAKYYRGGSMAPTASPVPNRRYNFMMNDAGLPSDLLGGEKTVEEDKMQQSGSPFVTFGKTPPKVLKSRKLGLFGSTPDVALISIAPISSPVASFNALNRKTSVDQTHPKSEYQVPQGMRCAPQRVRSAVSETPGKNTAKEDSPESVPVATPYKIAIYPWAVDDQEKTNPTLEICSTSTPPNSSFGKPESTTNKNALPWPAPPPGSATLPHSLKLFPGKHNTSPRVPPPPPPRSDVLILHDDDDFPPPPPPVSSSELALSANYADPYDNIAESELKKDTPRKSEYLEPVDAIGEKTVVEEKVDLPIADQDVLNDDNFVVKTSSELKQQVKRSHHDMKGGDSREEAATFKKRAVLAASSDKIYETYLSMNRGSTLLKARPEVPTKPGYDAIYCPNTEKKISSSDPELTELTNMSCGTLERRDGFSGTESTDESFVLRPSKYLDSHRDYKVEPKYIDIAVKLPDSGTPLSNRNKDLSKSTGVLDQSHLCECIYKNTDSGLPSLGERSDSSQSLQHMPMSHHQNFRVGSVRSLSSDSSAGMSVDSSKSGSSKSLQSMDDEINHYVAYDPKYTEIYSLHKEEILENEVIVCKDHKRNLPSVVTDHKSHPLTPILESQNEDKQDSGCENTRPCLFQTFRPAETPGKSQSARHGIDLSQYILKQPVAKTETKEQTCKTKIAENELESVGKSVHVRNSENIEKPKVNKENELSTHTDNKCANSSNKRSFDIDLQGPVEDKKLSGNNGKTLPSHLPRTCYGNTKYGRHLLDGDANNSNHILREKVENERNRPCKTQVRRAKGHSRSENMKECIESAMSKASSELKQEYLETDIDSVYAEKRRKMEKSKSASGVLEGHSSVITEIW